jgi:hypothetical protein
VVTVAVRAVAAVMTPVAVMIALVVPTVVVHRLRRDVHGLRLDVHRCVRHIRARDADGEEHVAAGVRCRCGAYSAERDGSHCDGLGGEKAFHGSSFAFR